MTSPMWVDRIRVPDVLAARKALAGGASLPVATTSRSTGQRFWSTPPRAAAGGEREVLQVTFTDLRLVNYLSVELAHFPHVATVEYQDPDTGAWYPLRSADSTLASPVSYQVYDSEPVRVGVLSARAADHPQHYGPNHWVPVFWRTHPTVTRSVRLVLVRQLVGTAPVDTHGLPADYSLGAREFQVGYRVNSRADVPRYGDVVTGANDFASSTDLLGSRVTFALHRDGARSVLTPVDGDYWRSAPQPVNYAVVCLYVDTRGADGDGQVVDRFYLDPLTVGAHCNLYYSSDTPTTHFEASDEGLTYPVVQFHGTSATPQKWPPHPQAEFVGFSHIYPSYIDADNAYLQWDPTTGPWWVGVEVKALWYGASGVPPDIPDQDPHHPILSFGGCTLRTGPGVVEFTSDRGEVASVPLDPGHTQGSVWRVVAGYNPTDTEDYPAGLTLTYQLGDLDPVTTTWAMDPPSTRPAQVRLGGYPDAGAPGIPGLAIRALVVKTVAAAADDVAAFLADPPGYVHRPGFASDDPGHTDNSILRLDPSRADPDTSPAGLFGGPGDRYADLVWTPVCRDYALKRGYLHLPPTKARYWKFEFTSLVAEPYESFVPIRRDVRIFTTDTVRRFAAAQQFSANPRDGGPGVQASLDLAAVNRYSDAVGALVRAADPTRHSPTEALYALGPVDAERLRQAGWVWGFQPWHVGTAAPQFVTRTRHVYETVTITHRTKLAYFAGIKSLAAYRVDYLADDDTEQYLDYLDDLRWVAATTGLDHRDGGLVSLSGRGEAVSSTLPSHQPVRAVQFATQQSDSYQILPDDDFTDPTFANWSVYGDADLVPGAGQVAVQRGWHARSYADLETDPAWSGYAALEGHLYAEVEGAQPDGVAGGGVQSAPLDPSGSGRIYVAAKVVAPAALSQPVVVQILSSIGDVVLASVQMELTAGEEATAYVGYTVGSARTPVTYAAVEGQTYGALEAGPYRTYESVALVGPVYVRAAQLGPTHDAFVVRRLSLFDDPVQWAFSVDGGTTWYDAYDVRNDPSGVLSLPTTGTRLRWRFRTYRAGAFVSAVAVRPWYTGRVGSAPAHHGMSVSGPNRSVVDQYPPVAADPMWQQWSRPVPRWWYQQ